MNWKDKLNELKDRCSQSGYSVYYSEYKGIGTLSIHDKDDEVYGWVEDEIEDDDSREEIVESMIDYIEERNVEYYTLQNDIVPFLKKLSAIQ